MSEPLDLAAIREREKGATEGPWEAGDNEVTKSSDLIYDHPEFMGQPILPWDGPGEVAECYRGDSDQRHADAEFIAQARQDIPALIAEIELLRADAEPFALPPSGNHPGNCGGPACATCEHQRLRVFALEQRVAALREAALREAADFAPLGSTTWVAVKDWLLALASALEGNGRRSLREVNDRIEVDS